MSKSANDFWLWICYTGIVEREELLQREFLFIWQQQGKGDPIAFKRRHEKAQSLIFQGLWDYVWAVQVLFPAPKSGRKFVQISFLLVLILNICQHCFGEMFGFCRSNGRFFARKNPLMTRLMTRISAKSEKKPCHKDLINSVVAAIVVAANIFVFACPLHQTTL